MAKVIYPDGREVMIQPKDTRRGFSLDELQAAVGGYIEIVHPNGLPSDMIMIVDEDGLGKGLAHNAKATDIYGFYQIVGPVVICLAREVK